MANTEQIYNTPKDNIPKAVGISLIDIGMTPQDDDNDIEDALATYIESLGIIVGENEIYIFQLEGFDNNIIRNYIIKDQGKGALTSVPSNRLVVIGENGVIFNQDNVPKVVNITLTDIGMTSQDTDVDIENALATYILSLNLTIAETELYFFLLDGFDGTNWEGDGWILLFGSQILSGSKKYIGVVNGTYTLPTGVAQGTGIQFIASDSNVNLSTQVGSEIYSAPGSLGNTIKLPIYTKLDLFNVGGNNWSCIKAFESSVDFVDQTVDLGELGTPQDLLNSVWILNQTTQNINKTLITTGITPIGTYSLTLINKGTVSIAVDGFVIAVGKVAQFVFNDGVWSVVSISLTGAFNLQGTNHVLLILDGTPIENGLKVRNFFATLPNDNTPYSIMTLGGTIDFMPDVSLRPFTSFGSVDKLNKLIVTDNYVLPNGIININFINMSFNNILAVAGNIAENKFENVFIINNLTADIGNIADNIFENVSTNGSIGAPSNSVIGNTFKNVVANVVVAQNINNNIFKDATFDDIYSIMNIEDNVLNDVNVRNIYSEANILNNNSTNLNVAENLISVLNMSGNTFKNVNVTIDIIAPADFTNNKFIGGKANFNITTDDITNNMINVEMNGYATLTDSRLRNCYKINDNFNILTQN